MSRGWAARLHGALLWLTVASTGLADWALTPPGDPHRNWSTTLTVRGVYDDNFNSTHTDQQSGFRTSSDIRLRAKVPLERLLVGVDYDYGVEYPRDKRLGGINQTHNLSATLNYVFNPRLALSVSETFVQSLQPQLASPFAVVQAGTYEFEKVDATLIYGLTPRWSISLQGSWDYWRYKDRSIAQNTDHEDYQTTVSAIYALNTRTSVGLNYQYGQTLYSNPGTNDASNAQSHSLYLSFVRRFNPRLSLQLSGGYTLRESGDGGSSTAPYASGSLVYNYGLDSALSISAAHSLSESTVGVTRDFSASENTTAALQLNHYLTVRLRTVCSVTYALSSFQQPLQTQTLKAQEQAITAHIAFIYAFRIWLSATVDYTYTRLISPDLPDRPYTRDQATLGMTLSY